MTNCHEPLKKLTYSAPKGYTHIVLQRNKGIYSLKFELPSLSTNTVLVKSTRYLDLVKSRIFKRYPQMQYTTFEFPNKEQEQEAIRFLNAPHLYKDEATYREQENLKALELKSSASSSIKDRIKMWRKLLPQGFKYVFPIRDDINQRSLVKVYCQKHGYIYERSIYALLHDEIRLCPSCVGDKDVDLTDYVTDTGKLKKNTPRTIQEYYYTTKLPSEFSYVFHQDKIDTKTRTTATCKRHKHSVTKKLDALLTNPPKCPECEKEATEDDFDFFFSFLEKQEWKPKSRELRRFADEERAKLDAIINDKTEFNDDSDYDSDKDYILAQISAYCTKAKVSLGIARTVKVKTHDEAFIPAVEEELKEMEQYMCLVNNKVIVSNEPQGIHSNPIKLTLGNCIAFDEMKAYITKNLPVEHWTCFIRKLTNGHIEELRQALRSGKTVSPLFGERDEFIWGELA